MRTTRLIAAAAVTIAAVAFAATPAQAAFSPSNQSITITGTITWKKAGFTPVNCTLLFVRQPMGITLNQSPPCNGRQMTSTSYVTQGWLTPQGDGQFGAAAMFGQDAPTPFPNTWMYAGSFQAPFYNGNASTPSTIVLNDTQAGTGYSGTGPVTWSGTLTVTQTAGGGLVTVTP